MPEETEKLSSDKQVEVIASWAPVDPRDLSSDKNASSSSKAGGLIRIFGSMHPVFNLIILAFDAIFKRSKVATVALGLIMLGLSTILYIFQ